MNNKSIPFEQRVFVNRSTNFGKVKAIGFDMDHTLAPYNRDTFEELAFSETIKKFLEAGYPGELIKLKFKPDFLIRGLLVDKDRGNLLKVDQHKYVKTAYHGHRKLTKEERHSIYNIESFKAVNFLSMDTYFSLSEVQIFVEIVDFMAKNPGRIKKSFSEVYDDLREFIDLSHRDGSIKNKVITDPEKYIVKDKYLPKTLMRLKESGKALFLLTNSWWIYTNEIMHYLMESSDQTDSYSDWKEYFDYVVVGSSKPGFFTGSQPFFQVMPDSGLLRIHNGCLEYGGIYHGGNAKLLEKTLKVKGDQILYVGDHIYGDIIRSKELKNWRTMLVVEEIDDEIAQLQNEHESLQKIMQMIENREEHDEMLQRLRSKLHEKTRRKMKAENEGDSKKAFYLQKEMDGLQEEFSEKDRYVKEINQRIKQEIEERENRIHPLWGETMKVGLERSRFADQLSDYACLYTSKVSNLRYYSPFKQFTSFLERMPHDPF